jgi:hypothetical protein
MQFVHDVGKKAKNQGQFGEIAGSHGGEYEDGCLLRCFIA